MQTKENMRFYARFKDFAIQELDNHRLELVKYHPGKDTCFTVAWINWDDGYELEDCGLRLMRHFEPGLNDFILEVCELMQLIITLEDEND